MIISLTGTPGTGKTSISRILYKNKIDILHINKIITKKNIKFEIDQRRKTKIIDIENLNKYIEKKINNKKNLLVIEGHLSHLLNNIDKVIILRCHPEELRKRLLKKKWNKNKINENIESEILDIILCESLSNHSKKDIYEIDTTGKTTNLISSLILDIIKNNFKEKEIYKIGSIDWSEEIFNIKTE
jgi:adenylate kinase